MTNATFSKLPVYRKFIATALLTFTVSCMAFIVASRWLIDTAIEPHDNVNQSLRLLRTTRAPEAAFGDSRIAFDLVPRPPMVNLAYMGETIPDMDLRMRQWLSVVPTPKRAILSAEPHLFSIYRVAAKPKSYLEGHSDSILAKLMGVDERHLPLLTSYWSRYLFGEGLHKSKFVFTASGWQRNKERFNEAPPVERKLMARARMAQQMPRPNFQNTPLARRYESMIDALKARGIEVCLVSTPVSPEYFAAARSEKSFLGAYSYFSKISDEKDVKYVNLFGHFKDSEQDVYFADVDHLREDGAQKVSDIVADMCWTKK